MAEERTCSVHLCGRKFVPGRTGANGMCQMHARRADRGSVYADEPNPVYGRGRSQKLNTYVTPDVAALIAAVTGAMSRSVSEWAADRLEAAAREDAKRLGL